MKRLNATALGTTSFLVAVGVVFSLQTQVVAQSNNCPATPRIGYKCYQDRNIRARSGYPGSNTGTFSYSPPAGYRLMDYRETVHSRFGEGGNLNVDLVRGGAVTQIRRVISDYNRALSDRKSRAESYAQWSIRVGGETETIENALRENNSRLALLEDSYSNVDRVNASVTVSGRCTRVVLGTCVDNQGGQYEGTVRFQLEYVGTPGAISAANDAVLKRIDAALQRFEQEAQAIRQQQQQPQQPPQPSNAACPPTFSPSSFQGRTGRVAFFNEWSSPVTVVLYHPSNGSVFNRYTVSPRQNSFLGSNIVVGDDWGVCFENKPNSSGVVNNVGILSDYNPNWEGSTLFMIQNPRIR